MFCLDSLEDGLQGGDGLVGLLDTLSGPNEIEFACPEDGRGGLQEDIPADGAGIDFMVFFAELGTQVVDHKLLLLERLVELLIAKVFYFQQLVALLLYTLKLVLCEHDLIAHALVVLPKS